MRLMFVTYPTRGGMAQATLDLDRVSGVNVQDDGTYGFSVYVSMADGSCERFVEISRDSAVSLYEDIVNHMRSRS